jgi:hypothetical protein
MNGYTPLELRRLLIHLVQAGALDPNASGPGPPDDSAASTKRANALPQIRLPAQHGRSRRDD